MNHSDLTAPKDRYSIFCQIFILILPLHGISFFDVGFNGSPDNIFIILAFLLISVDYLIFEDVRWYVNERFRSKEVRYLIMLLILMFMFDIINVIYYGSPGFLADRIGTIMLVVFFACGVSTRENLRKTVFCWMIAGAFLALQNILSNMEITPAIQGSRFHDPGSCMA